MRHYLLLGSTAMLAGCGGGTGVETVGSVAPPAAVTPTPTPTPASFVNPTEAKTYEGLGGVQHYEYATRSDSTGQTAQLYAGDANTVRDSGISITYDPRDAIFDLTITRPKGIVSTGGERFQDPVHRTDFGGLREPQASVPHLADSKQIQYLQAGSASGQLLDPTTPNYPSQSTYPVGAAGYSSSVTTFFYQKPGTTTKYVTYAGFVSNTLSVVAETDVGAVTPHLRNAYSMDRATFVYGERTSTSAVPKTGTGSYSGDMIATLVFNPRPDTDPAAPTYFQWIDGSQTTTVDFGSLKVATTMTGTVTAPALDAYTNGKFDLPGGSTFTAHADATIDLVGTGGFTGTVADAKFARPGMSDFNVAIAGSSIDGAFFGPAAEEVGGGFRVVGGTPDQRIDILGSFTGKK